VRVALVPSRIPLLAGVAILATFASVGLMFLMFGATAGTVPQVSIPLVALLLAYVMLALRAAPPVRRKQAELARHGGLDPVTPLPNPAFADHFLASEFSAAQRGRPLTVVHLRIDNFQRVAAAHDGGESGLLADAGRILRRHTRGMNLSVRDTARPDTFVSILSDVNLDGARVFVQRVRKDFASLNVGGRPLAVSAGAAGFDFGMSTPAALLAAADMAVSRASRDGGNRVVVCGFASGAIFS
jgi:diguanylate cyclase (GGDEF)-like protein